MTLTKIVFQTSCLLWFFVFLHLGCQETKPNSLAEALEEINSSKSGLVQVVEHSGRHIIAKYLTPQYLAWVEVHDKSDKRSIDSIADLYRNGLRFYLSISETSKNIQEKAIQKKGGVQSGEGVLNVGSFNEMFYLEAGGQIWRPVSVMPESRVGVSGETWLVVFAIDPYQGLNQAKTVSLVYSDVNEEKLLRFTYKVADILRPAIITSNE